MINNNRKWVILNVSDVTDKMIDNSIQTSLDTLRKNSDNSKCILKWSGDTPSCFNGRRRFCERTKKIRRNVKRAIT